MQYTTRHLPTGTAFISHATPTRVAALSWHLHRISLSPPAHTTWALNSSPSMITQHILKKTSDLIYVEDDQSTRDSPGLHGIEPLSGIEVYTMDTQPSPLGSHRSYRYGHIRDILHPSSPFPHVVQHSRSNPCPPPPFTCEPLYAY
jgi:hypothetical protein